MKQDVYIWHSRTCLYINPRGYIKSQGFLIKTRLSMIQIPTDMSWWHKITTHSTRDVIGNDVLEELSHLARHGTTNGLVISNLRLAFGFYKEHVSLHLTLFLLDWFTRHHMRYGLERILVCCFVMSWAFRCLGDIWLLIGSDPNLTSTICEMS